MEAGVADYAFNKIWSPAALEPPSLEDIKKKNLTEREWFRLWWRSILFHTLKWAGFWLLFGFVPFQYLGVQWDKSTFFWLQLLPWLMAGSALSGKIISKFQFHHMVNLNDAATLKFTTLFMWPFTMAKYFTVFYASWAL